MIRFLIITIFFSGITFLGNAQQSRTVAEGTRADSLALNRLTMPYQQQIDTLFRQYDNLFRKKDTAGMIQNRIKNKAVKKEMQEVYRKYAKENPKSSKAVYALTIYIKGDVDAFEVKKLFNSLPPSSRESVAGKKLKERIETACKTSVGQPALAFVQQDTAGNNVSLASFKGKYVLIDFWASWCGPCRRENPNVVKTFNRYKDSGFTILSVSLDKKKEWWLSAIHQDGMPWTHVSDLKGWKNEVAQLYGIHTVPQNVLLDPDGKIIARNLRGTKLEETIGKLMSKSN